MTNAMRALEDLTPSGSEYVGDIARCVEFIRQRQASQHQHIISLTKRLRASSERDRELEAYKRGDHPDQIKREEEMAAKNFEPIEFCESDGTERRLVWEPGDHCVGIPSGFSPDDTLVEDLKKCDLLARKLAEMIDTYHKRILKTPVDIDSHPTAADIFAKNSELLLLLEEK